MMFLDCPAYLDAEGDSRCGLPAEIRYRYIVDSSDGPLESAMIRCPSGHWFNAPIEYFTREHQAGNGSGKTGKAAEAEHSSRRQSPHGRQQALMISQLLAKALLR